MPGYARDDWVVLHDFQQRDWAEIIRIWRAFNSQLLHAAKGTPLGIWTRACRVAGASR